MTTSSTSLTGTSAASPGSCQQKGSAKPWSRAPASTGRWHTGQRLLYCSDVLGVAASGEQGGHGSNAAHRMHWLQNACPQTDTITQPRSKPMHLRHCSSCVSASWALIARTKLSPRGGPSCDLGWRVWPAVHRRRCCALGPQGWRRSHGRRTPWRCPSRPAAPRPWLVPIRCTQRPRGPRTRARRRPNRLCGAWCAHATSRVWKRPFGASSSAARCPRWRPIMPCCRCAPTRAITAALWRFLRKRAWQASSSRPSPTSCSWTVGAGSAAVSAVAHTACSIVASLSAVGHALRP